MRTLTIEDLMSIRLLIEQIYDSYFIFDNQIFDGKLTFYIKGKIGPIPDEIAASIISELAEYKYESQTIELMGFGQSIIVTGRSDD